MDNLKKTEVTQLDPAELLKAFGVRPGRMQLLTKSLEKLKISEKSRILETGCSFGDGIAHATSLTGADGYGLDIVEDYIEKAQKLYDHIQFNSGSIYGMPYENCFFDIVFSQAAFSLLTKKNIAIDEFARVLVPGGYVLINDFVAKNNVSEDLRNKMDFIPCFNSIGTIDSYRIFFEERGFETVIAEECYNEIITTTLHLSKYYKCTPMEMAALFAHILGTGRTAEENCRCFFRKTKISYASLIFRKR